MAYAQSNGYTDISGGFNPQNNLQSIMALLQGGARPEGVSAEVPSSLRPIEPYSTPKPLTSARGVEMAMPPEQMPFMAAPYSAPQQAERTGMQSPSQMAAPGGNIFNTKFVDRYSEEAKGPLGPNQHVAGMTYPASGASPQASAQSMAPPAQAKAASQPYVSSYWKNVDKVVSSNDKRNAKFAATFAKSLR